MSPNEGHQWQNLLGCENWVLSKSPELTMVGFRDLVGVGFGSVSKKLAVKYLTVISILSTRELSNSLQADIIQS